MHYPDEQQILSLLRELITQSGMTAGDLENEIGWEPGRLGGVLAGQGSLSLRDFFAIVSLLEVGTSDFFSRVYGLEPREAVLMPIEQITELRFEESQRVIKEALSRRTTWKRERADL